MFDTHSVRGVSCSSLAGYVVGATDGKQLVSTTVYYLCYAHLL